MSNFKSFVTTQIGMNSPIGGEHRAAFVAAMMKNGVEECPIRLKFYREMLDEYLERASMGKSVYMLVEGTLFTRDWEVDINDDGSVLYGSDVYVLVERFQILDGAKDQHKI